MANLPEISEFTAGVYQIETTDPVLGGVDGITNVPLKALTNRTKFLKDRVDELEADIAGVVDEAYVQGEIDKLSFKPPVRAASTTNLTLSGTQTVDGVALLVNDRILVKNQSTASQNGIYVVQSSAWTRAADMNADAEIRAGVAVIVTEGTSQAETLWILTTDGTITIGSTALAFANLVASKYDKTGGTITGNVSVTGTLGAAGNATLGANSLLITGSAGAYSFISSPAGYFQITSAGAMLLDAGAASTGTLRAGANSPLLWSATGVDVTGTLSVTGQASAATSAQFDADTTLATTEFVQRALGNARGIVGFTTNTSLTAAHAGMEIYASTSSGSITLSLPAANAMPAGAKFKIFNTGVDDVIVTRVGGDTIVVSNTSNAVTAVTLKAGDSIILTSLGSGSLWYHGGGTAQLPNAGGLKTAFNVTGSAPMYACRAWVNFNGTGTVAIRASGNVSSITDNGAGDYTVNFTTAMPDANYAITTGSSQDNGTQNIRFVTSYPVSSSATRLVFAASGIGAVDAETISVAIFR